MSLFERLIDRGDEQFGGVAVVLSVDEAFRRLIHIDLACDGIERGLHERIHGGRARFHRKPDPVSYTHLVISQKTEDLVGPYELHDFFLYYMLRVTYEPLKIYRVTKLAFAGVYDEDVYKRQAQW